MYASDNTTPPRTGMRRLISPWGMRNLRLTAGIRFAVVVFLLVLSAVLIAVGYGNWAAVPLAGAALNFAWAYWELSIARSAAR